MKRQPLTLALGPYRGPILQWMPEAEIRLREKDRGPFDGLVVWKRAGRTTRYLAQEKRHLRHQDVGVVAEQLARRRRAMPPGHAADRILVLAPHVRPQQATVLERAGIDYVDLAGNAHLAAPGLFVHVEGRQRHEEPAGLPGRPQKGWIKTVMVILVRPELAEAPYRIVAAQAGVALGTVAACMKDLAARGVIDDGADGRIVRDRQAIVALWVQAYTEGLRPKLRERRFQVRADTKQEIWTRLQTVFAERALPWALTGADAAQRRLNFFRAEETEIYAPIEAVEDRNTQKAMIAQPTDRGGNLLIIDPPGPLATAGKSEPGLPVAPHLLTYAELRYRGTGQALEAAEQLLPTVLGHAAG
jgi:hypothetical protein